MADDAKNDKPGCPVSDELIAGPVLPGGVRPFIQHTADHNIMVGTMRQVPEGTPIHPGEGVLALSDKGGGRYDVTTLLEPGEPTAAQSGATAGHKGPARVNTKAYQDGWDALFGKKPVAQA